MRMVRMGFLVFLVCIVKIDLLLVIYFLILLFLLLFVFY